MDPIHRPSCKEVCQHLFFWSYSKRLEFLVEFSDRLEHEPPDAPIMLAVEAISIINNTITTNHMSHNNNNYPANNCPTSIIGSRWDRRLDPLLLEDMKKYRKYDTSSVRDLLRVIRNKRHHFNELSTELKASIGSLPNGFYNYFHLRFPSLLLHCADIANKFLSKEKTFTIFLSSISPTWRHRRMGVDNHNPTSSSILMKNHDDSSSIIDFDNPNQSITDESTTANLTVINNINSRTATTWESNLQDVVILQGSTLEASLGCHGWMRSSTDWVDGSGIYQTSSSSSGFLGGGSSSKKARASHLIKSATDLKYRTRLCSHWEMNMGGGCPMRKRGKCIFAHGPLELRVKESRRDKWGKDSNNNSSGNNMNAVASASSSSSSSFSSPNSLSSRSNNMTTAATGSVALASGGDALNVLRFSGGEDVLGAARQLTTGTGDKPSSTQGLNQNDGKNNFMNNYNNMQPYLVNHYMMPMQPSVYYHSGHTVYYPNNYQSAADASNTATTYQHATNDSHNR